MMNLLEYNDNITVSIVVINYLKEAVEDFSQELEKNSRT